MNQRPVFCSSHVCQDPLQFTERGRDVNLQNSHEKDLIMFLTFNSINILSKIAICSNNQQCRDDSYSWLCEVEKTLSSENLTIMIQKKGEKSEVRLYSPWTDRWWFSWAGYVRSVCIRRNVTQHRGLCSVPTPVFIHLITSVDDNTDPTDPAASFQDVRPLLWGALSATCPILWHQMH